MVEKHIIRNKTCIDIEKLPLQKLPSYKAENYALLCVPVSSSSTIQVRISLYTVSSNLIGNTLQVHLYNDDLECFLSGIKVAHLECVSVAQIN